MRSLLVSSPLPPLPSLRDRHATTRALACFAASLAIVNAAFVLWPEVEMGTGITVSPPEREMVAIQLIEPTRQPPPGALPPAPPPPPIEVELPPEEVPDEVILDEIVRNIEVPTPPTPAPRTRPTRARPAPAAPPAPPGPPTPPAPSTPPPATDRIVEQPDRSPRLRGQALPVYPRDVAGSGFRGRARVKVLVSAGGQVTDAEIVERVEFRRGREEAVTAFPDAFETAVLDAARRHLFSPARDDGERVRAFAFLSISLDPPE